MKICEYGCGREAKYYIKTSSRWCCSESQNSCPEVRKKNSEGLRKAHKDPNNGLNSILCREKQRKAKEGKNNPMYGRRITIEKIQQKCETFSSEEGIRYNPDKLKEKEIQVRCKNSNCPNSKEKGGWFNPTGGQINDRIQAIEKPRGFGESNFYCSQYCKDQCTLFGIRSDPYSNTEKPYTSEEQRTWRSKVLTRENYICELCEGSATIAHHVLPVKTHPLLALDPDNGVACCKDCHYKYGHKTGTECSTGALANRDQPDCKLGGKNNYE